MSNSKLRHYVVHGRIPGDDADTMAYVQVGLDDRPSVTFIRDVLYDGKIPDDWESRDPTISENKNGEWAYIHDILEFPCPPIEPQQKTTDHMSELIDFPPHDPNRFQTTDGLCDPKQTNGIRAENARKALKTFQQLCRMSDDPISAASDLICNLLHHVHGLGLDPMDTVSSALDHFRAEAGPL